MLSGAQRSRSISPYANCPLREMGGDPSRGSIFRKARAAPRDQHSAHRVRVSSDLQCLFFRRPGRVRIERIDRTPQMLVVEAVQIRTADPRRLDFDHFGRDRLERRSEMGGTLKHQNATLRWLDAEGAEEVQITRVPAQVGQLQLDAVAPVDLEHDCPPATGSRPGTHWPGDRRMSPRESAAPCR